MDWWVWAAAGAAALWVVQQVAAALLARLYYPRLYWVWDDGAQMQRRKVPLDYRQWTLPRDFLWGTSTAAHQVEGGCTNNNWADWEKKPGNIKTGEKCGQACDHWARYKEDAALVQQLGCNAYRFSVEWSKLEPSEGAFDAAAIRHYHDEIDDLLSRGIEPMVTLHHFTEPRWFADAGGFSRAENIDRFVAFAVRIFSEYSPKVRYWCTINEPEVFAAGGWFDGAFPPGAKGDLATAGAVLQNLCLAHARVYRACRAALPNVRGARRDVQIGLVKNIFQIDPRRPLHPLDQLCSWFVDSMFNRSILEFLRSGNFRFLPFSSVVCDPEAPSCSDFVGLNYYSHYVVTFDWRGVVPKFLGGGSPPFRLGHPRVETDGAGAGGPPLMSDMPQTIYPEGLYRALMTVAKVRPNVPVYVTENGIADAADDRRHLYILRYLAAMNRAREDGVNVRGYFYWSLLDNFEWAEGYSMKFGLYAVDFATQRRTLRDGSRIYRRIIHHLRGLELGSDGDRQ